MSTVIPSLKAAGNSSGSAKDQRRNIAGEFLGFEGEGNLAKIKLIMPGSVMDGRIAVVGLEEDAEGTEKRTAIATRKPGKTEKIKVGGKTMEVPLKTDWYTAAENEASDKKSGTIVNFTGAFVSGPGKGGEEDPYQFTARWSGTVTQELNRVMAVEHGINVTRMKDSDRFFVTVFQHQNAALIQKDGLAEAIGQLGAASSGDQKLGASIVAFDADKKPVGVIRVFNFVKYDKEKQADYVPNPMDTFNEALKKSGADLSKADTILIMPHTNLTVSTLLEPRKKAEYEHLVEMSKSKSGDEQARSGLIVMSPADDNGHSPFVAGVFPQGFGKNPLELAMVQVGMIEPRQASEAKEEKAASNEAEPESQPEPAQDFTPMENF